MISTRRLAAILAADVVGFSALMERDEENTVRRIQALRTGVIDPLLTEHRGRLVKVTGDGILVEFASPLSAVLFAMKLQKSLNDDPGGLRLRIGINLGDIIVEEDGDVYGEGVNVAARLEALCEPGGILVSSKIHSEVFGKIPALFEDQGEKHVKNISKLIHVFAVRETADGAIPPSTATRRRAIPSAHAAALTGFVSVAVAIAVLGFWQTQLRPTSEATPAQQEKSPAKPASVAQPAATAQPFDGVWKLTITCPPSERLKAAGYTLTLAVNVTDGELKGELGRPGAPGAFQIAGTIRSDGTAPLKARGVVNDASRAAGNAPAGAIYEYTVDARFAANQGSGKRIETRPCDLLFER
jgi:class 3 adenylate cyclase